MGGIVWLASYPKSGNTWVRVLIETYLASDPDNWTLSDLRLTFSDALLSRYDGVSESKVESWNHLNHRDAVLEQISSEYGDIKFIKTHSIFNEKYFSEPTQTSFTGAGIYIVRDPRDVCLSFASHFGLTLNEAAEKMGDICSKIPKSSSLVEQDISSWADHVESWIAPKPFPVIVVRYEDLVADAIAVFGRVLTFLGFDVCSERLQKAAEVSTFRRLKEQEEVGGFAENSTSGAPFFRKGTTGQWKTELPNDLVTKIERECYVPMAKLGYLI